MKRFLLPLACVLALWPSAAQAGINLRIDIGLPVAPPLVEVEPGIQVVEGFPEEVFFTDGWYWCRRPDGWYRARSPRARFAWVERRYVPARMVRFPAGGYRDWHRGEDRRGPGRQVGGPGRHMEGPGRQVGGPGRHVEGPGVRHDMRQERRDDQPDDWRRKRP
jgi:hypothetical protein